jgi:hypothetical protein
VLHRIQDLRPVLSAREYGTRIRPAQAAAAARTVH